MLGTSFAVSVKVNENSDNIALLISNTHSTGTVIKAGKSHEGCCSSPELYTSKHDPNELIYDVKRQVVRFQD